MHVARDLAAQGFFVLLDIQMQQDKLVRVRFVYCKVLSTRLCAPSATWRAHLRG